MNDPSENTLPEPASMPNDRRPEHEEQDKAPALDADREDPVHEDFDDLLSGSDDVDPDIAP